MRISFFSIVFAALALTGIVACNDDIADNGNVAVADVTAAVDSSDTADSSAEQADEIEPDLGTPGPGADVGNSPDHECQTHADCLSPVECGIGRCIHSADGNKCLVFARLDPENFCDDESPCTIDSCNTAPVKQKDYENGGCSHKPRVCDDHNPCTLNVCDENEPDGCLYMPDTSACNDSNACTQDSCLPGGNCEHVLVTCDDADLSTKDGCTASGGCYHTPVACGAESQCSDNDPCTVDWCNAQLDCVHESMICNDGIPCTTDSCFGGNCIAIPNCVGGDECGQDTCNPLTGDCETQLLEKSDNNPCTLDSCDSATGWSYTKLQNCCVKDSDCTLGNQCLIPVCDTAQNLCASVMTVCNDGIACTLDSCFGGNCIAIPNCVDNDECTDSSCNPLTGDCETQLLEKSDNNPCTLDSCDSATGWSYTKLQNCCVKDSDCTLGDECMIPVCDTIAHVCASIPLKVDDGIACTIDSCMINGYVQSKPDDSACANIPGKPICSTELGCVECYTSSLDCDDSDPCTLDNCIWKTGTCSHEAACQDPMVCIPNGSSYPSCDHPEGWCTEVWECPYQSCNDRACVENACVYTPTSCEDGNLCTTDSCTESQGCQNKWKQCDDDNACTSDDCNNDSGECEYSENNAFCVACTQDDECTTGSKCFGNSVVNYSGVCHQGQCFHDYPNICSGSTCYDSLCQDGVCVQKPKTCDDNDACTKDSCDYPEGCEHKSVNCDDYSPCTLDSCNPATDCANDWDFEICPDGPDNSPCGNFWNCGPCQLGCDDGFKGTYDQCVGYPDSGCLHSVIGLGNGVGILNLGEGAVKITLQQDNSMPFETIVFPYEHFYAGFNAKSLTIYSITDFKTGADLGFPASLPCINGVGSLTKGKIEGGVLVCSNIDG